jgi:hypothetical protein
VLMACVMKATAPTLSVLTVYAENLKQQGSWIKVYASLPLALRCYVHMALSMNRLNVGQGASRTPFPLRIHWQSSVRTEALLRT